MANKTQKLRAVLDTNIIISALKSKNQAGSPNNQAKERWKTDEWILLYCDDIYLEYIEKLKERKIEKRRTIDFLTALILLGVRVSLIYTHVRNYPDDEDDIYFILCALNGKASHLVTRDEQHILPLRAFYSEFKICLIDEFLEDLLK